MKQPRFRLLPLLLALLLVLTACSNNGGNGNNHSSTGIPNINQGSSNSSGSSNNSSGSSSSAVVDPSLSDADLFTDRDKDASYNESESIVITLNGNSASCSSNSVMVKGSTVTITGGGTYIFSGSFKGMIVVNAKDTDKPHLVLNNASITSAASAALYILECDKTILTLAKDSENTLANGGSFTAIDDNNIDGALYSKQDLSINGEGTLTVTSPAGHGIVCKDDFAITGGQITVTSASHAIDANDSVRISATSLKLDAGKDGIHAENNDDSTLGFVYISGGALDIEAEGDGISAGSTMQITGGIFSMITGGGSENASHSTSDGWGNMGGMGGPGGMGDPGGRPRTGTNTITATTSGDNSTSIKGLKSAGEMYISGGTFTIDSADDAVHSNASITVTGGSFTISSGDDGFHADETLTIRGGTIKITESYEGLEGLHISIEDGDISLKSSDDGLNAAGGTDSSGTGGFRGDDMFGGGMGGPGDMGGMGGKGNGNGSIKISGGKLYIEASGDGIDANGTLEISGGYTILTGPTQGDTAVLDYDKTAIITGGTFIGTGSTIMAQAFSDGSTQGYFAVQGKSSAGTTLTLTDSSGKTVLEYTPTLNYSLIVLSSPDIISGQTYTITLSNGASGTFEAY